MIDKNSPLRLDEGHIVPLPPPQKADQDVSPPTPQKPDKRRGCLVPQPPPIKREG